MTLANGSAVLASDITSMLNANLVLMQADNGQLTGPQAYNLQFNGVVAATSALRRKASLVVPQSGILDTIAVMVSGLTAASTFTLEVGCDTAGVALTNSDGSIASTGWLVTVPLLVNQTGVGAGLVNLARLSYDGAKTRNKFQAVTNRMVRVLDRGQIVGLRASTTSVAAGSVAQVQLVMRSFLGRD